MRSSVMKRGRYSHQASVRSAGRAMSSRMDLLRLRIAQHAGYGLAFEALPLREAGDELLYFGTRDVQFLGRSRPGAEQHEKETCGAGSEP